MTRTLLTEAATTVQATAVEGKPGRFLLQLITPGWGTSGYYAPTVLEAAAAARVFPKGTHLYLDHERGDGSSVDERGNRSVSDLAAVLAEDAYMADGGALVAEAMVFSSHRKALAEMAESIGLSIRAYAETSYGEAEGRHDTIIDSLIEARSVDFVTRAGRGGKILAVLESAALVTESRNIGQWIESRIHRDFTVTADDMAGDGRLTREERIGLSSAIGDALAAFVSSLEANQPQLYERDLWDDPQDTVAAAIESHRRGIRRAVESTANDRRDQLDVAVRETHAKGEDDWAWVRDFDEEQSLVWFERGGEVVGTFEQSFTVAEDDAAVSLTGDPVEVSVRTTYVPVNPAGQPNTTTEESEEDTMPEIAESELRTLREAAGRVQTLESERDTAVQRAETAESERDELREANARTERAATVDRIVGEAAEAAGVTLDEFQSAGIATRAVFAADGAVDESKTREVADKGVASVKEAQGAGRPRGLGGGTTPTGGDDPVSESDLDALDEAVFGKITQEA